ncbi:hypothetical protein [Streptomyces sp. NPDC003487]
MQRPGPLGGGGGRRPLHLGSPEPVLARRSLNVTSPGPVLARR